MAEKVKVEVEVSTKKADRKLRELEQRAKRVAQERGGGVGGVGGRGGAGASGALVGSTERAGRSAADAAIALTASTAIARRQRVPHDVGTPALAPSAITARQKLFRFTGGEEVRRRIVTGSLAEASAFRVGAFRAAETARNLAAAVPRVIGRGLGATGARLKAGAGFAGRGIARGAKKLFAVRERISGFVSGNIARIILPLYGLSLLRSAGRGSANFLRETVKEGGGVGGVFSTLGDRTVGVLKGIRNSIIKMGTDISSFLIGVGGTIREAFDPDANRTQGLARILDRANRYANNPEALYGEEINAVRLNATAFSISNAWLTERDPEITQAAIARANQIVAAGTPSNESFEKNRKNAKNPANQRS